MKKHTKKLLGFFGLLVVGAVTTFAAFLPAPDTNAATSASFTDTVSVRVVGNAPDATITGITNQHIYILPEVTFSVDYNDIAEAKVILQRLNADGSVAEEWVIVDDDTLDYQPGTLGPIAINLDAEDDAIDPETGEPVKVKRYGGYGDFVLSVDGIRYDGVVDTDKVAFSYYPAYGEVNRVGDTDNYELDLTYAPDDGTGTSEGKVATITVRVYDENGNEVPFSPIYVTAPTDKVSLPFGDYGLPDGKYTIKIFSYDRDGNQLSDPYVFTFEYTATPIPVPDTGGLFQNLNIAKSDYLITGLVVFGIVAVAGVAYMMRRNKR